MSPQPARVCSAKQGLIEDIRSAMTAIIHLNNREMERVIKGKPDMLSAIHVELVQARQRKDSLLEAYNNHVLEHGC